MDRLTWMYKISRASHEYINGVNDFIELAEKNLKKTEHGKERMTCPCRDCYNLEKYSNVNTVREHLFRRGFMDNYTKWIWHGEGIHSRKAETFSGNYESCGDSNPTNIEDDEENDRFDEMIQDVEEILMHQPKILENLVDDSKKLLYTGCNDQFTRLSTTLKLCNLKVKSGWSDKSFTELLKLVSDILPSNNELPISTYEAKKILCPMGMNVKKIHACPYDCVLFRNEYEHLDTCPKCGASRYKREGNNSSSGDKKRPPAKVLRYLPIVERFKCLFANVNDAKLMRWHVEGRKADGMLRHPADSPQWRSIDGKFPDFGGEARNLRLGLCADGMNPYRTLSSSHSTWPVLLTIYNLPPWLCMKRKYIMLTLLIPGPKEAGNNIDVYLQPLIEDLKLLWEEGQRIYDAYSQTNFTLRAMIFCTISDFPGYGNLSGYTIKGAKACPICEDSTIDLHLNNCRKNVYMGHRTFLHPNHPYRKRKKSFDGTIETRVARLPLTGKEVFERVKDINVVLGKLYKKPTPNSLWKKRSILWDLPYWEHLQVRHCLDFMHIEKNVCESVVGTLLNIPGKTKDGIKARKDMQEMGIRVELAPQQSGKRAYLPPACFTLSRKEKISFCECLSSVKVPIGYSSNPNEQTRRVFEKMGELQTQVLDGSWTPEGHDDILSRALGRKEHGGRVRGVGGGVKIKEVFRSNSKVSGVISADQLATITQEITKKVQKECEDRMNQMMNLKIEGIYNQLKEIGVSLPDGNFVNDIGTPQTLRSSCHSVDQQDLLSNLKGPTLCHLWVVDQAKTRVVVARGTVFPANIQSDNMIHNKPIAFDNVRVSIDDVPTEYQLIKLPVPSDEHETVGSAAGSFVQWPKDLVTLGQDPLEKNIGHERTPKNVSTLPRTVESKGSVTLVKRTRTPMAVLGDDTSLSEHCRSLRFLLNKRISKDEVFKFEEIGEQTIYVTHEDVDQFLKMSDLNVSVVEIFIKYVGTLCTELNENKFAFMLPSRLAISSKRDYDRINEAADYMTTILTANKERHFILAPFVQDNHWMLLLFSLKEAVIYVFDSLKQARDIRLRTPVQRAFKLYTPQGGLRNNRKEFLIIHTEVQCPQQKGDTACGFFVMRYMHDIIMHSQKNADMNWKVVLGSKSYTKKEINEMRELWAKIFIRECL